MAYIYKITNDINGKIYIGKTYYSIEKRFKEHCSDAFKERNEKRPLYAAILKYGTEHFHISVIEETNKPEERERYWIEYFGSFKNGYNATRGGDGKPYCDYDLIYALYNEGKTCKEIASILHYDPSTCSKAIKQYGITDEIIKQRHIQLTQVPVLQINKNTDTIINIFPSITAAYQFLNKQHSGHIAAVCQNKRKTAYGYKWRYAK